MPGSRRPERLAEQIREEVSLIIGGEIEDPRLGVVTVTDVKLSPDLRYARIYVSAVGSDEEVRASLAALRHATGFIRHQLGFVLRMRRIPELTFIHDQTDERAARIEELLSQEVKKATERESVEAVESDGPAASDRRP
jgi:ribosome-binding factor A